jgi:phosphatidate cytidylyltransferase
LLRTRVVSGIIGIALLIVVVSFGEVALGIAVFLLALLGVNEFYDAAAHAGYKPIKAIGFIACAGVLLIGLNGNINWVSTYVDLFKSIIYFSFCIFGIIVILFAIMIFLHDKYTLNDIALTVFGIFYVVFLFAFIILTRNLVNGKFLIWLVFIGAFATDTAAYFTGSYLGRIKFLPAISKNKTLEGAIGGVIGCIVVTALYGMFINRYIPYIPLHHYIIIGILNGVISQIGDWAASAIKRYVNIKDYGSIMPGHGGVLDRFDSILFTAPVVYFYFSFLIL